MHTRKIEECCLPLTPNGKEPTPEHTSGTSVTPHGPLETRDIGVMALVRRRFSIFGRVRRATRECGATRPCNARIPSLYTITRACAPGARPAAVRPHPRRHTEAQFAGAPAPLPLRVPRVRHVAVVVARRTRPSGATRCTVSSRGRIVTVAGGPVGAASAGRAVAGAARHGTTPGAALVQLTTP